VEKVRLGVSSCLLGEKVRYDGGHKLDPYLTDTLGRYFEWVPVCPEVEYGLSVPREPMRLVGSPDAPRLVTARSGIDRTAGMLLWAERRLLGLLLILSHSPKHYTALGRLVSHAADYEPEELWTLYLQTLVEGLKLIATAKKNTNVLHHLLGFLKRELSSEEKQELLEVIEEYHRSFIPPNAPIVLLQHYVRKHKQPYLQNQYLLHPPDRTHAEKSHLRRQGPSPV
jgi:uncharacterized protein YbgA (DUF1722 family)